MPSCCYGQSDAELFEELSETVSAALVPLDAQRLAEDIQRALWSGNVSECFNGLAVRWPSLVPLVLITGTNLQRQRRLLQMLKTIFEALSTTRRSGMMPVLRAPVADESAAPESKRAGRR